MLRRIMRNSTRFRTGLLAALAPLLPLGCADSVTATDASADTGIDLGAPVDRVTPPDTGTPVDTGTPIDVIPSEDRPDALDAPYFQQTAPCSLLIDEIEALWSAVAERDDWEPFAAKVEAIRAMAAAHGRTLVP